jgi:NAD(P)-dependent dehydrogenase (short-subunit alcohol dehydrogenase family)
MNVEQNLSPFSLAGKRALVTGATKGIGKAIAHALCEMGAEVVLLARPSETLDSCVNELKNLGYVAKAFGFDLSDTQLFESELEGFGTFDIVIHSAGMARHAPFLEVTKPQFDDVMSLNLDAAFWVSQACAKKMVVDKKPGAIIFISSQMGHVGGKLRTVYCASKHALEGLTKAMAIELGPHQIRVNTVAPTFIETELTRNALADQAFRDDVLSRIKIGRIGLPEDVAYACCYLASDAASLVTGTSLVVDGGWTAE